MSSKDKITSVPETERIKERLSRTKQRTKLEGIIKNGLYDVERRRGLPDDGGLSRERLTALKKDIDQLAVHYPDDPELKVLTILYDDLLSDFENNRERKFDDSFEQLIQQMSREIASSGVVEQKPDQSDIPEVISALRECGIEPSYVVSRGDKTAKTVVYFMQFHPGSSSSTELGDAVGVRKSQEQIYEALKAAIGAGLGSLVYGEGVEGGKAMSTSNVQEALINPDDPNDVSYFSLKTELGEEMSLVGLEDWPLLNLVSQNEEAMDYRGTAHNVFLADVIDDHLGESSEQLAFVVLGAGHEKEIPLPQYFPKQKNPLPFSHVLAYYGYNVVVVNAAHQHIDRGAFDRLFGK